MRIPRTGPSELTRLVLVNLLWTLSCSSSDPGAEGSGGTGGALGPSGGGTVVGQGGSSTTGGIATGGALGGASTTGGVAQGGQPTSMGGNPSAGASGGSMSMGGSGTGGSTVIGGSPAGGGVAKGGTTATGGRAAVGGVSATGGQRTGGAPSSGGATATGGASTTGGTKATGGATATGGLPATGGAVATGGATTSDRCDVGVHNPAAPPQTLTLSGDLGTHDPVAIESNGSFYLYATGLGAKTSTDLRSWRGATRPFGTPAWLTSAVPGVEGLWAPDISFFNGKYHLYYSGSTFGSNRSCIGHATRTSLSTGSWVDDGAATICSNVGTSDNWNAIDPNLVLDTDGKPWLSFGSFWSGLKIIPLDAAGKRLGTAITSIANHSGGIEAPFIVRRCGYYYLFVSWDRCCQGASSTYNIRVGRSTSVTGPYVDKAGVAMTSGGGTLMTQSGGSWRGPGHQGVVFTGNKAYLIYHAYRSTDGASMLRVSDLVWDASGWPVPVGP